MRRRFSVSLRFAPLFLAIALAACSKSSTDTTPRSASASSESSAASPFAPAAKRTNRERSRPRREATAALAPARAESSGAATRDDGASSPIAASSAEDATREPVQAVELGREHERASSSVVVDEAEAATQSDVEASAAPQATEELDVDHTSPTGTTDAVPVAADTSVPVHDGDVAYNDSPSTTHETNTEEPPPASTTLLVDDAPSTAVTDVATESDAEVVAADVARNDAGVGGSPFTLSVGTTTMYQSLVTGDRGNDALVGYLDLLAEAEVSAGTTATIELESVGGDGPDADVPSFASTVLGWNSNAGTAQDDAGFDRVYLAEIFLSTDVLGHDWVLDFGKIASTGYLDTNRVANDSTGQFLSGAFVNSAATQIPFRGAGVALTWLGSERCDVRLLAMRPDNSGDDATSGVFGAGQFDWFWTSSAGREGSCGVFVFSNGAKDDQLGLGVSFDQDCSDHCTAFARLGWQDEVDVSPQDVETAWSFGCELREPMQGCVDDVLGLALGCNASHDIALDDEWVYEAYYKRVFSERVHASFHAQGMNHPGGDPDLDQVTSLGLRLQINL